MTDESSRSPAHVPTPISPLIGRTEDVETVARLVATNRLVTLIGPGGVGKTRLAEAVAQRMRSSTTTAVWVDLSAVTDDELVASAVSRSLMLPEDRDDRVGGLARRLRGADVLLVLDNCEHLLGGVAGVVTAVLGSSGPAVLATSRAPLNLGGEASWNVPVLAEEDAAALFLDRARRAGAAVTESNAVAEICARLDGIPLAIELAAARTRVMSPAEIAAALRESAEFLAGPAGAFAERHRTIAASLRWSYSLLPPIGQALARRLSVFAAPFTLDAASAVGGRDAIDGVQELVEHSMLHVRGGDRETRFRMLDTVREFLLLELEGSGESARIHAVHADYFAARARGLWPLFENSMAELLDRADAEYPDMAAMLGHLEAHAPPEEHAAVAMACLPAIAVRHVAEAAELGDRVAARVEPMTVLEGNLRLRLALVDPTSPEHVARAVAAARATGDDELGVSATYWDAINRAGADPTPLAMAEVNDALSRLVSIGEIHFARAHWMVGAIHRAIGHIGEAVRLAALGRAETVCLRCLSMVWAESALLELANGRIGAAEASARRATDYAREVRDAGFLAFTTLVTTELAVHTGSRLDAAAIDAELDEVAATGNVLAIGLLHNARALYRWATGDHAGADADLASSLELIDGVMTCRTESRVRRIALRHRLGDIDGATALLAALREDAARWDAGPWLTSQIALRAAELALDTGDTGRADDLAHRALSDAWLGPWPSLVVDSLELLCRVATAKESYAEATRLHGAAAAQRTLISYRFGALDSSALRSSAGSEFDRLHAEGARLTLEEAVAYARRARGGRKRPTHGWDGLTPMERQVAELAVEGLTNAEIAARLFVGRETVKTHLSNAYSKVGVANRTQLVAAAARRPSTS